MPDIFAAARATAEAEAQALQDKQTKDANDRQMKIIEGLQAVSNVLAKQQTQYDAIVARLDRAEKGPQGQNGGNGTTHQTGQVWDPYAELDMEKPETVRRAVQSHLDRALTDVVPKAVEGAFEKMLGPQVREAAAIQQFKKDHPNFDMTAAEKFLAEDADSAAMFDAARKQGAVQTGLELIETRMALAKMNKQEQNVRSRAARASEIIRETRPDAQLIGGGAASPEARNVGTKPLTHAELQSVFNQAEVGNWNPFEKEIHASSLPSEDWFQRLAQS